MSPDPERGRERIRNHADDLRELADSDNPVAPIAAELLSVAGVRR